MFHCSPELSLRYSMDGHSLIVCQASYQNCVNHNWANTIPLCRIYISRCDQFQIRQVLPGKDGDDSKEALLRGKTILVVPFVNQILPRFVLNLEPGRG